MADALTNNISAEKITNQFTTGEQHVNTMSTELLALKEKYFDEKVDKAKSFVDELSENNKYFGYFTAAISEMMKVFGSVMDSLTDKISKVFGSLEELTGNNIKHRLVEIITTNYFMYTVFIVILVSLCVYHFTLNGKEEKNRFFAFYALILIMSFGYFITLIYLPEKAKNEVLFFSVPIDTTICSIFVGVVFFFELFVKLLVRK